ncbi:MAG: YfcE family phosphodiesterase [Anaerolineae bacterium]|nr:YfcE family phosphodiesterase [Anaerolineae bacterium]
MLVGILADTHIPYRIPEIPTDVIEALRNVDVILHAGDVDDPWALSPLQQIAPVYAVRGNYHVLDNSSGGKEFPRNQNLTLCGSNIVMTHGHMLGWSTLFWRMTGLLRAALGAKNYHWRDAFTSRILIRKYPSADIYIFGHTHRYYHKMYGQKLVLNPGAACSAAYFNAQVETSLIRLTLDIGAVPVVEKVVLAA